MMKCFAGLTSSRSGNAKSGNGCALRQLQNNKSAVAAALRRMKSGYVKHSDGRPSVNANGKPSKPSRSSSVSR